MLKLPTKDDIPDIVNMIHRFHQNSVYKELPFDEDKVWTTVERIIDSDGTRSIIVLSVTDDGFPTGLVVGLINESLTTNQLVATELAWWVEPEFRKSPDSVKLVDAYEYWAAKMGATRSQLSLMTTEHHDVLSRFYKRRGYTHVETGFMKEINNGTN